MPNFAQRLLLTDPTDLSLKDLTHIEALNLSGYFYRRLPAGHPLRPALQANYLALTARHALIRQELRELLAAWNKEQLPALLMKGFALAEFEYATPAERFYGDVDILVPHDPAVISRMVHLALARGWRSDGQHADPGRWTHECAHLVSPLGHVKLDVHHLVTGWVVGSQRRQQAVTQAVWQEADVYDWQGITVYRPSPHDQVVVNVALGRTWGGDAGGLKVADYTDMQLLLWRYNLQVRDLQARAAALGAGATWQAFTEVCNPARGRFAYQETSTQATLLTGGKADGHFSSRQKWHKRLQVLPGRLLWMLRLMPDMCAAHHAWKREKDPRKPLSTWQKGHWQSTETKMHPGEVRALMGAINWWTRLLYPRQHQRGVCVPRAYATYRSLHRLGYPVFFVSGVARSRAGIVGHAWIEDQYGVADWYDEPLVHQRFQEQFRWPRLG